MTNQHRDVQRKIKVLRHAEKTGCVARTCRYFGIGRASFYRWRGAYEQRGEAGLINAKPIPRILSTERRLRSPRRSCICAAPIISGRSASFGISRATTASNFPKQASPESSNEMV